MKRTHFSVAVLYGGVVLFHKYSLYKLYCLQTDQSPSSGEPLCTYFCTYFKQLQDKRHTYQSALSYASRAEDNQFILSHLLTTAQKQTLVTRYDRHSVFLLSHSLAEEDLYTQRLH